MRRTSTRLLGLLLAVALVCSMSLPIVAVGPCDHANGYAEGAHVEATCTSYGYTPYFCPDCGKHYLADFEQMVPHAYEEQIINALDCQTLGQKVDVCSVCGDTVVKENTGYGPHHFDAGVVTLAATCLTDGVLTKTCTICGEVENEVIPSAGAHDYQGTEPTCTTDGVKTCSVCGDQVITAAIGHQFIQQISNPATHLPSDVCKPGVMIYACVNCDATFSVQIVANTPHTVVDDLAVAATCTETGLTAGSHCSVCGEIIVAQNVVPALGHDWDGGTIAVAAECENAGVMHFECTRCDAVKDEAIDALGHTPVVDVAVDATCTSTGLTEGSHCSVCGAILVEQVVVPMLEHTWGAGVETLAPTCSTEGNMLYTCTVCGTEKNEPISTNEAHNFIHSIQDPTCTLYGHDVEYCNLCGLVLNEVILDPLGHTPVDVPAIPADCQTLGRTAGTVCSVCQAVLSGCENVPMTDHAWGTGVETLAPTCTANGVMHYTCSVCGQEKDEDILATGHDYQPVIVAPTCVAGGYTYDKCTVCDAIDPDNDHYNDTPIDPTAHVLVVDYVINAPTCTTPGNGIGYCTLCDAVDVACVIPTPNNGEHTWDEGTETVAPSCTAAGEMTYTCTVCGAIDTEVIDALGHTWDEGVVTLAPTCGVDGTMQYTCTVCGATNDETINATGEHTYDAGVQTTPPSCNALGTMTYTCTVCGNNYDEDIPMIAHTEVDVPGVAATCVATGLTDGVQCSACNEWIVAQEVIDIDPEAHHYDPQETPIELRAPSCKYSPLYQYTCVDCGLNFVVNDPSLKLPHTWDAGVVTVEATCTEPGQKTYTCTCVIGTGVCGETRTEEIPATGHTPGDAATCTEAQVCTVCGAELNPATGHTPNIAAATCTEAQVCTVCGAELNPATGHTPNIAAATCTEAQVCTVCGAELNPATGHTPGDAATCTEAQVCTVCGAELNPATGHTPGDAATCTEAQVCTVCGAELNPALGHLALTETVVPAECEDFGFTLHACARCLQELVWADVPTDPDPAGVFIDSYTPELGHDYQSEVVLLPTCTETGLIKYLCTHCGEFEKDNDGETDKSLEIEALGHHNAAGEELTEGWTCSDVMAYLEAEYPGLDAEDLADAFDSFDTVCVTCGEDIVYTHTDLTNETVNGGCGEWNYELNVCDGCGKKYYNVLGQNPDHDYQPVVTPATCIEYEKTEYICTICGDLDDEQTVVGTVYAEHDWDAGTESLAATCTEAGTMTYVCQVCGEVKDEEIPATGHGAAVLSDTLSYPPSLGQNGQNVFVCPICNEVLDIVVIPANAGMEVTFEVFNPNYQDTMVNFVNSGYVDVVVKVTAYEIVANSLQINFAYDPTVLEYVGMTKGTLGTAFSSTACGAVNGECTVMSYNADNHDIEISGEDIVYVTVHFKVLADAYVDVGPLQSIIAVADDIVCNMQSGATVTVDYQPNMLINIKKLGDVNSDGVINVTDIIDINDMINNFGYSSEADINKDGGIDYADLALIEAYIIHNISYDEMVNS